MKNHGPLSPLIPASKRPAPRLPRALQTGVIELLSGFMSHEKSVARYGSWEVVALVDFAYRGNRLAKGDRCQLPGNVALVLANYREVEFIDARLDEEDKLAAEVARLKIPLAAKDNPAFSPARRPEFANAGFSDK